MSKIKISVCIPVYGVEKYIERCARSLFEQTMKENIEFIFVNDCTQDKSIEILKEILKEYPLRKNQVKILQHKKNKGLVEARNTAIKAASGEYIIHCDPDDWVNVDLYEKMYTKAEKQNADIVFCASCVCTEKGKNILIPSREYFSIDELFQATFCSITFNSLCNKLVRREIAVADDIAVKEHINMQEDLLRTSQILQKCKSVGYVSDSYYHYFQNSNSLVHTWKRKNYEDMKEVYSILSDKLSAVNKKYTLCLLLRLYTKALLHYNDRIEDKSFYQQEILRIRSLLSIKKVVLCKPFSFCRKIIVIAGMINYRLTSIFLFLFSKIILTVRKSFSYLK